jgi:hypothetical protein
LDAVLQPFTSPASVFHYRDPVTYRDILDVIASFELQKLKSKVFSSLCYCIQIDGSLDTQQTDNKFVCIRYIEQGGSIQSALVGVVEPDHNGARGLLEAIVTATDRAHLNCDKIVGITTDSESANTGVHGGLWKLLQDELKKKIITVWCTCHRSDLVMEDMENCVPELKLWRSNLTSLATYFRTSKCRNKVLLQCGTCSEADDGKSSKILAFPAHHEVRFAEHLQALVKAALHNLSACRRAWRILKDDADLAPQEKAKAEGFLNVWSEGSVQMKLRALMYDICDIYYCLQAGPQRDNLIIPDVLTLRDAAIRKLDVVLKGSMPGGKEEHILASSEEQIEQSKGKESLRQHLREPRLASVPIRNF